MGEKKIAQDALDRFIDEALRNTAGEPSADFTARLMARVAQTPQTKRRTFPARWVLSAVAACAVVVLGLGFWRITGRMDKAVAPEMDAAPDTSCKESSADLYNEGIGGVLAEGDLAEELRKALGQIRSWDRALPDLPWDGSFTLDGMTYRYSLSEKIICCDQGCAGSEEICRILEAIKEN